jgi:PAS domain S-box-containing protein
MTQQDSPLRSKEYFEALLQDSPIATVTLDMQQRILLCNPAFEKVFGYKSDEAIGQNLDLLIVPEPDIQNAIKLTSESLERHYIQLELLRKRKDGSLVYVEVYARPVFIGNEQVGVIAGYLDISDRKKAQQQLQRSEELFHSVWDAASDGMELTTKEGIVLEVNQAYCQIMEIRREDIVGAQLTEIVHPSLRQRAMMDFQEWVQNGSIVQQKESTLCLRTGRSIIVEISRSIISTPIHGEVIFSVMRDITNQKRSETLQNTLYHIADATGDTQKLNNLYEIIDAHISKLIDTRNVLLALYDRNEQIVSYPFVRDERMTTPLAPHKIGKGIVDYVIRAGHSLYATSHVLKRLVERNLIDQLQTTPAQWIGVPLKIEENVVGVIVVQSYHDADRYTREDLLVLEYISHQLALAVDKKRAEEQIRTQLAIINQKNAELEFTRDKAIEASKAKSAFLANMSHELRTPLNVILGYTEILSEDLTESGMVEQVNDLDKVQTAGKTLLQIVSDVLDISKIEAGKMEVFPEDFNLEGLIGDVSNTIEPLVTKQSNRFVKEIAPNLPPLYNDHVKIKQILFNLLSNASKFTENGIITIRAFVTNQELPSDQQIVEITVEDTGIGIAEENLPKLFNDFTQVDGSTTRKYGGTGLGLSLTKRFCEMLKGDISITSTLGKGTSFTVRLPVFFRPHQTESGASPSTIPEQKIVFAHRPRLLIIDDDADVGELLTRFLEKEGYDITITRDGNNGIVLSERLQPALIILDILLPGRDGWSVLHKLKHELATSSIPIILHTIVDNKAHGMSSGANEYLVKPIDREILLQHINRHIRFPRNGYVLIVTDDQIFRSICSRIFSKADIAFKSASDQTMAISFIEQSNPGLVLFDLPVPHAKGPELLLHLQNASDSTFIPVIIVTDEELSSDWVTRNGGNVITLCSKKNLNPLIFLNRISTIKERPH